MTDTTQQSPTEKLKENLPETPQPDPEAPRMPFRTNFVLTRGEEDALVQDTIALVEAEAKAMGRGDTEEDDSNEGSGRSGAGGGKIRKRAGGRLSESFLSKRSRWT